MTDILEEIKRVLDKKEEMTKQALKLLLEASFLIKASIENNSTECLQRKYWLEDYNEFKEKFKAKDTLG